MPNMKGFEEIFQALISQHLETGEMIYIDYAIGFTAGILNARPPAYATRGLRSKLSLLLKIKAGGLAIPHLTQANEDPDLQTVGNGVVPTTAHRMPNHGIPTFIKESLTVLRALSIRFEITGDVTYLQSAITLIEGIISATPHPQLKQLMRINLPGFLHKRYLRLGELDDLHKLIQVMEEVVNSVPPEHSCRAQVLDELADSYCDRFDRLGSLDDLDKAIRALSEIILSPDHPNSVDRLQLLGRYYSRRYGRLGDLKDLQRALQAGEKASGAASLDDEDRATYLNNWSMDLASKFDRLGAIDDLEKSIQVSKQAVELAGPGHPGRANMLTSLSKYFHSRFVRLGNIEDSDRSFLAIKEAVACTPDDLPRRAKMLNNLAAFYSTRFGQFGCLHDLQQAIQTSQEAVAATLQNPSDRPYFLLNLSIYFHRRYQRLQVVDDLQSAIQISEEALGAIPLDHPGRVYQLYHQAIFLSSRFDRFGTRDDLEEAIQASDRALAVIPLDHSFRAMLLTNLGDYLSSRWDLLQNSGDLVKAIRVSAQAVEATPLDHPNRAGILIALSSLLRQVPFDIVVSEYEPRVLACGVEAATGSKGAQVRRVSYAFSDNDFNAEDHELIAAVVMRIDECSQLECLDCFEEPTAGGVVKDVAHAPISSNLLPLQSRIRQSGLFRTLPIFDRSLQLLLAAWCCRMSPPRDRIQAARLAARHLAAGSRWKEGSDLLQDAVRILPQLSPQFLRRDDQQYMLSEFTQLASVAVSMALNAGATPSNCLSLLELGRGVIMGLAIDCRSDSSELRARHPDIFNKFDRLRVKIDSPLINTYTNQSTHEHRRQRRVQDIHDLDETLATIRQLPNFESFQLGPTSKQLIAMAADGPIIIFNATELRSDALIVASATRSLPLPKMIYSEVLQRMEGLTRLVHGKRSTYASRNGEMERFLVWLWEVAVEPVFEELGFYPINDNKLLPRVWWIGVGPLATAPFHAAGDHSLCSTRNTISNAISSYIPTGKALLYAREKKLNLRHPDTRLLLVTTPGAPKTPITPSISITLGTHCTSRIPTLDRAFGRTAAPKTKWKVLKNVSIEADEIIDAVNGTVTTRLDSPSTAQVLKNLSAHDVIHLACHGVSDSNNPSNSHLILHDNASSDPERLTVGAISNLNLQKAQVAYLSACCTAANSSFKLADESIHIASGFQLAGFSHVLATMWDSHDDACRQVAGEFYRTVFNGDPGNAKGHQVVSSAFHHAVHKLRKDYLRQPIKWASFIHTGA